MGSVYKFVQRGSNTFIEHSRYLKQLNLPLEIFVAKIVLTFTLILHIYYLFLPISACLEIHCNGSSYYYPYFWYYCRG